MTILLDCAHGAASIHVPTFSDLGAKVILRGCSANGTNINDNVGALHPPSDLQVWYGHLLWWGCRSTYACRCTRKYPRWRWCIMASSQSFWRSTGRHSSLQRWLGRGTNGRLLRSAVGDANVEKLMHSSGALLGAEPSGHILFGDGLATGDGTTQHFVFWNA